MTNANHSVCVVDPDEAARCSVATSLSAVASDVRTFGSLAQLPPYGADLPLLIVNYDALDATDMESLRKLLRLTPHSRCVLCSAENKGPELADLCEADGLTNIVARNMVVDRAEIVVTARKILEGDIFGIDKYFGSGARRYIVGLTDSERRAEVVDAAEGFAEKAGVARRLVAVFGTLTDEFVTNALYNAPTGLLGRRRYTHLPRAQRVFLEGAERVEVRLLWDERQLGVSVTDPFGSLTSQQVRRYMATYFRSGIRAPRRSAGGAGLGMFAAFEAVTQFVCNIGCGRKTEVIGLIDAVKTYRDFAQRPKSFHVFVDRTDR